MFSEKKPESAATKVLDEKTVSRVWEDFEPYRKAILSTRSQSPEA